MLRAGVVLLLPVLAACSMLPAATPSPTPAGSWPRPPAVTGDARALLLTQEDVPEGWEPRAVDEPAGFRAFPCGVDVEPAAPLEGDEVRFVGSPIGPYLVEYVRVQQPGQAAAVVGELDEALETCTRFEIEGDGDEQSTLGVEVERVDLIDDVPDTVMWKQTVDNADRMVSYTAYAVSGDALVVMVIGGVAIPEANDPNVLASAMRSVLARG